MSNETVEKHLDQVHVLVCWWALTEVLLFVIAVGGSGLVWLKTESVPLLVLTIAGGIGASWFVDHFFFRPWNRTVTAQYIETACQEGGKQPNPEFSRLAETTVRRMREKALVRLVGALAGALLGPLAFSVGALIFSAKLGDLGWWVLGGGILGTLVAPYIVSAISSDNPES